MVAIAQTQMVHIASYLWEQTDGPTVKLSDIHTVMPTFVAPYTTSDTTLTFRLTVTDDDGAFTSTNANVKLRSANETTVDQSLTSGEDTNNLSLSKSANLLSPVPTPTSVDGAQNSTSSLSSFLSSSNSKQFPIPPFHLQNSSSSFSRALVDGARPPTIANSSNVATLTVDRWVSNNISGTTIPANSGIAGMAEG